MSIRLSVVVYYGTTLLQRTDRVYALAFSPKPSAPIPFSSVNDIVPIKLSMAVLRIYAIALIARIAF